MNKKIELLTLFIILFPVLIFSQELFIYNEANSPLTSNKLTSLAIDSTNNFLIGSDTILYKFSNNNWTTSLTSSSSFKDIDVCPNGNIFTITNFPNNIWEQSIEGWQMVASFPDLNFSPENITIKNDTKIFFVLINQWPHQMGENEIALYNGVDSLSRIFPSVLRDGYLSNIYDISSIAPLNEDSLLVTDWEGFHLFDGNEWKLNNPSSFTISNSYYTTKVKRVKNHIFVLGDKFYEYKHNLFSTFPEIDSILSSDSTVSNCIAVEKDAIYWIGTSSGKLIKYNGFTKIFELTSSAITDIVVDKFGNKWFISNEGLFVFNEDKIVNVKNTHNAVSEFKLYQNYPNPFNPTTTIKYSIPSIVGNGHAHSSAEVSLKIFDILGREVATLVNKKQTAGKYKVSFKASNQNSGVYLYVLQSGNYRISKKMLLIK